MKEIPFSRLERLLDEQEYIKAQISNEDDVEVQERLKDLLRNYYIKIGLDCSAFPQSLTSKWKALKHRKDKEFAKFDDYVLYYHKLGIQAAYRGVYLTGDILHVRKVCSAGKRHFLTLLELKGDSNFNEGAEFFGIFPLEKFISNPESYC